MSEYVPPGPTTCTVRPSTAGAPYAPLDGGVGSHGPKCTTVVGSWVRTSAGTPASSISAPSTGHTRPSIVNDPFLTYTASSPCVAVHSSSTPASSSAVNDHSENSRGDIMRLLQLPRATTVGATYPER